MRKNPKGVHYERWMHAKGCRRYFNVARDTVTHEIYAVYEMGQPAPDRSDAEERLMSQVNRLPQGGRIDRTKPLRFMFDGKPYQGYHGDTLASALLANGVRAGRPQLQVSPPARHPLRRRGGAERADPARPGQPLRAQPARDADRAL